MEFDRRIDLAVLAIWDFKEWSRDWRNIPKFLLHSIREEKFTD